MNWIRVDAIKVEQRDYLPKTVKAEDGHSYHVLGVVVERTECGVPVVACEAVLGRRLCVLLGNRVADPPAPEKAGGAPPGMDRVPNQGD